MLKSIIAVVVLTLSSLSVSAQTPAFTYQGKLTDGGAPANGPGPYQMQFTLFPSKEGGDPIGPPIQIDSVDVRNGVFTVELNFTEPSAFNGGARWLQIAVKRPTGFLFSLLTPRQPITSTPYALRTLVANSADTLSSACTLCITDAHIQAVDGSKVTGTVENAATATTATNVSGVVQIANGGTGTSTQNFVDLSTNQNIGGNKTFTGGGSSTGTTLTVTGTQPPPSSGDGTNAPDVLRVLGAKGGNTSNPSPRALAGTGGNVLIQAGDGGDSSIPLTGVGGSITLQPGTGGFAGNVLLAPANGLVGIGTTSPQSTLHVFKSAEAPDTVGGNLIVNRFFSNAGGPGGGWRGASLFSYFPSAHNHDVLAFGVSENTTAPNSIGAVKMVVSANGNVGIGATNPLSKLHVFGTGTLRVTADSDSNAGFGLRLNNVGKWSVATVAPGNFQIFNDALASNAFFIDRASNDVGIGTSSPSYKLEVVGHSNGLRVVTAGPDPDPNGVPDPGVVASFGSNGEFQIDSPFTSGGRFRVMENSTVLINNPPPGTPTDTSERLIVNGLIKARFATGGATTPLCVNGSDEISFCGTSSIRYKENVNNFSPGLDLIRRLRPVSFNWKQGGMADMGLIAEEVAKEEPLLTIYNGKGEIDGVKYDRVGVVLINAVKEQQAQIEKQQKLIESQQQQIDELKKLVCATNPAAAICKN